MQNATICPKNMFFYAFLYAYMQEVVYVIEKNIFLAYMFYNIKEDFFLPKNCKINKINEKYITDI